ncbi:MAG: response regulator [Rhodospirillaceae bacterium]|nr:response regulator [Rhodospirillaceae bacterium]
MKKIVIIDDDDDLRTLLVYYFQSLGFDALEANNGNDGLAASVEHSPDVVILDINMPTVDGFTTLEAMRNDARINKIPVVVLSSFDHVDNRTQVHKTGCTAFARKPIELDLLRQFVEEAMDSAR